MRMYNFSVCRRAGTVQSGYMYNGMIFHVTVDNMDA